MHTQHASDLRQRRDPGIRGTGLDGLVAGACDAGREEHALLGAVLAESRDANAVTDGAALGEEPVVVIGQVRHSINALPMMIFSQPGLPGIF